VLAVGTGGFGRTPRISHAKGSADGETLPGEHPWRHVGSLQMSCLGIRGSQVGGATDRQKYDVKSRRVAVRDFLATICRHRGINVRTLE